MFIRIPKPVCRQIFVPEEANLTIGNLYFHPNPLLRRIFWERLHRVYRVCRGVPARRVLDLGCGGGELLPSLAGLFPQVWGMDFRVTNARKVVEYYHLQNVTLLEGDFLRQDLPPGGFDLIVAADVLEHQRDLEAFCRRMHSVLKSGGTAVVCLPVEGFFYRLGRKLFGISPPEDHFQGYRKLRIGLDRHFRVQEESGLPLILPLFRVLKYVKK